MVAAAAGGDHRRMVASTITTRLADAVTRRRHTVGPCSACRGTVFADEHHLRLHGVLMHRRCTAYRPRLD